MNIEEWSVSATNDDDDKRFGQPLCQLLCKILRGGSDYE